MKKLFAFTLAEVRLGTQVYSYTCATAKGGQVRSYTRIATKAAFTLAEVLITLAVIGVVAALTIPNLIQSHNEKAWATAQDVFTKRLEVATRQMNTEEKLAGYKSTMDFVNELKKYIKITRVCDSNELTKCFEGTIHADYKEIDLSEFEGDRQFTKDNWGTETLGVQFANGVNALVAYNPNTTQDPYNNQFSATAESMAILYDVSGNKNPNTIGKDINLNANVNPLGCLINPDLLGDMCITQILGPQNGGYGPMTKAECEAQKGDLEIKVCYESDDYWAGAVKVCGGVQNMPTLSQLHTLAMYIYPGADSIDMSDYGYNLNWDADRASLFLAQSPDRRWFQVWGREEAEHNDATCRPFETVYNDYGAVTYNRSNRNTLAFCLDH